jgi:O-antigen/teichoic acid export membrane protein
MRGMKAGAVMLAGVAVVNLGNYLFHLVAARDLGPQAYGDLVALLTLSSLVTLPIAALQIVVSRYVASLTAVHRADEVRRLNRRVVVGTTVLSGLAMLLIAALAPVIESAFSIASRSAVLLTALLTLPTALTPVIWGVAQGLQRFTLLALAMAIGTVARLVALAGFLLLGLATWSAVAATLVGMVVSFAMPFMPLRSWFARGRAAAHTAGEHPLGSTAGAAVALLAFTSLTQADVLAANVVFSNTTSGIYAAASLIGRVILYLPTAVVSVLLPKVAARSASNRASHDILGFSLIVTVAFCGLSTVVYGVIRATIVDLAFGSKYDAAAGLLVPFGIAMTLLAAANVLLYYHLGHGSTSFVWVLAGASLAQLALFALVHGSPRQLIFDTIAVSVGCLIVHEALTQQMMVRSAGGTVRLLMARRR